MRSVPGLGRPSGEGNGDLLQYPCLENSMDRGAWGATVRGAAKSCTQLKRLSTPKLRDVYLFSKHVLSSYNV